MSQVITERVSFDSVGTVTIGLYVLDCSQCGVIFAINTEMKDRRYKDGKTFYCPSGHGQSWHETAEMRERKRRREEEQRVEQLSQELAWANTRALREKEAKEAAQRSNAALKGVVTRTKRKAAHALCPVDGCGRQLVQMKRHLEAKHPQWVKDHEAQT